MRIVSVAALVLSAIVAGFYSGFEKGSHLASCVVVAGETGYQLLANHYFYVAVLNLCFLLGTFIKRGFVRHVVCISAMVAAIAQLVPVYLQKIRVLSGQSEFLQPLRQFIVIDIAVAALLFSLLAYQVVSLIRDIRAARRS
jgi:hypothetical protein